MTSDLARRRLTAFLLGIALAGTLALLSGCALRGGGDQQPWTAVAFEVRDEAGDPIVQDAYVQFRHVPYPLDEHGNARPDVYPALYGVPVGSYGVAVRAPGYENLEGQVVTIAPGENIFRYTLERDVAPGAPTPPSGIGRPGRVRLEGHALRDDAGMFHGIGASLFWAMCAAQKGDWDKLDRNLHFVREHGGANYVRILGEVGGEYWRDCQINPRRSEYVSELRLVLDHVGRAGMRAEITIFGGLTFSRTDAQRRETVRKVLRAIKGREHLVQQVEIANEPFHEAIGFRDYGRDWVSNIRELGRYYLEQEAASGVDSVLLALGSPALDRPTEWGCLLLPDLYRGFPAGRRLATLHYDRNMRTDQGVWRHVRQPWFDGNPFCNGSFDAIANDEPSGPGASVSTMDTVSAHAAMLAVTAISGGTATLFHAHGGIVGYGANAQGKPNIYSHSNAASILRAMRSVRNLLPSDIANWRRFNHYWDGAPFQGSVPFWPHPDRQPEGVTAFFSSCRGATCWSVASGIKGRPHIRAAYPMQVTVHGYTGRVRQEQYLTSGQGLTLHGTDSAFDDRSDMVLIRSVRR